jgi:hypothetical protein
MEQVGNGWRKSSHSGNGANCVEIAAPGDVLVRDTTDRDGCTLSLSPAAWTTFVARIK